jgi:hypothetical protein
MRGSRDCLCLVYLRQLDIAIVEEVIFGAMGAEDEDTDRSMVEELEQMEHCLSTASIYRM